MPRGVYPRRVVALDEYRVMFESLVDRGDDDECWWWQGRVAGDYGRFCMWGRDRTAHVAAMIVHGVEVPKGSVVMHSCDHGLCVNWVRHLRVGTQAENRRDCAEKGRAASGDANGMRRHPERSYFHRMRPDQRRRGEAHPNTKVSDELVAWIRKSYTGERGDITWLANECGISRQQMLRIVRGESRAVT